MCVNVLEICIMSVSAIAAVKTQVVNMQSRMMIFFHRNEADLPHVFKEEIGKKFTSEFTVFIGYQQDYDTANG